MESAEKTRLVTNDGWGVSFTSGTDIDGVILHVYKFILPLDGDYSKQKMRRGEADGLRFNNIEEAQQYAYERGYLAPFVHPWCPKCRVMHTFLGKRSGFCQEHGIFT